MVVCEDEEGMTEGEMSLYEVMAGRNEPRSTLSPAYLLSCVAGLFSLTSVVNAVGRFAGESCCLPR